jgi:hypothetical protein
MTRRSDTRTLRLGGQEFATPLTIPSFSSRAKPPTPLAEFFAETLSGIVGPILISAYDVANAPSSDDGVNVIDEMIEAAPSFVLLDSGGYEANWNERAERAGLIRVGSAPGWSRDHHSEVLTRWPTAIALLAVTFDVPDERPSLDEQVGAAEDLVARFPHHAIELLLKPSSDSFDLGELTHFAPRLGKFPVIGVTEDEIGASMADRLRFLAAFRDLLDAAGSSVPIHVFGGLDPMMTPLYFAAGADIFDGLSWLRYAYAGHMGIYDKSFVATQHPTGDQRTELWRMRLRNIEALVDLQLALVAFAGNGDFAVYGENSARLVQAWEKCAVPF